MATGAQAGACAHPPQTSIPVSLFLACAPCRIGNSACHPYRKVVFPSLWTRNVFYSCNPNLVNYYRVLLLGYRGVKYFSWEGLTKIARVRVVSLFFMFLASK